MASTSTVKPSSKRNPTPMIDLLSERTSSFLASSFLVGTDESRGIITIVYKCSECGDTDTERLFSDKPIPKALCCVKCRAGFGVDERSFGVTNHAAMWPMVD